MSEQAVIDAPEQAATPESAAAAPEKPVEETPGEAPGENNVAPPGEAAAPFYSALPEDWRAQTARAVAGEGADEDAIVKLQKQMERYGSFADWEKSNFEARRKLGEKASASKLPEDATEEQVAEWRAANGVPEAADKYEPDFGEGVVLQGADKEIMDSLYPIAHEMNLSNDTMSALGKQFFKSRAQQAEARQQQDGLDSQEATKQLKEVWKSDFATNTNILKSMIGEMPEGLRDTIVNARLPGGKGLMNDPNFANFMVAKQRQANPTASLVPSGDGDAVGTLNDEIAKLEARMGTDEWYKDEPAQARYRQLIDAREKYKAQGRD